MLTKISTIGQTIASTFLVLVSLLVIAIIGVIVAFVGYFLVWGILGLAIISGIAFIIYAAFDELKTKKEPQ